MSWFFVLLAFLLASFKTSKNTYKTVSVVIPAFNEENTVAEIVKIVKSLNYVDEVVVVDDGSSDNTGNEAKSAGARVLRHKTNKGKGAALKTGFQNTNSDIIAFIDADIFNLSKNKVDAIIRPILEDSADITKTRFARESGRVTELTAKPLLKFFFPEIDFEQPLSGQFAGKRSALRKIKFEEDYGVDVGIVLDADIQGIKIEEIDIGNIQHDMSPLADLHIMANEVVRTIINRAVEYGRVTMMDTLGNYIRWGVVGLSLIILGLFVLFFVTAIPLFVSLGIVIIGVIITLYFTVKLIIRLSKFFKKGSRITLIKSFINMHFPFLVCAVILVLMLSTFMSAAVISDGSISIEPTSRNLILFPSSDSIQPISVRGPYGVDSAIENETDIVRFPSDALASMQINSGDYIKIKDNWYSINDTRDGEGNTFRIPQDARDILELDSGDVIRDSRLFEVFDSTTISHTSNSSNLTNYNFETIFTLHSHKSNQTNVDISVDNRSVKTFSGSFLSNSIYTISMDGKVLKRFTGDFAKENGVLEFYNNGELYIINFTNPANESSSKQFIPSNIGPFLSFHSL